MSADLRDLLRHIARDFLAPEAARQIELGAAATLDDDTLRADAREALEAEEATADQLHAAFRGGLARALDARRAGKAAVWLNDRQPAENRAADALVHFLVRAGLATSTTRETAPGHYAYGIAIDWPRLEAVAREAGVGLESGLLRGDEGEPESQIVL
jgi:hypothetical protein